jgi:hypothetical protein
MLASVDLLDSVSRRLRPFTGPQVLAHVANDGITKTADALAGAWQRNLIGDFS